MYSAKKREEEYDAEREDQARIMEEAALLPIAAATAKKVERKVANANKSRKSAIAKITGPAWLKIANPQTRTNAIAELTEAQGLEIAKA